MLLRRAGFDASNEVTWLFLRHIARDRQPAFMRQSQRERKGIIPDLLLRAFNDLFNVKGQTLSNTFLEKSGFRKAVNAKENGVDPNYRRRAPSTASTMAGGARDSWGRSAGSSRRTTAR